MPTAVFIFGTTQYNYNWQGSCPTCDMNNYAYPTANYTLSCGDTLYPCHSTQDFSIACSIIGQFLVNQGPAGSFANLIYQRAISIAENTQIPIGNAGWTLAARCSSATSPPDFNPVAIFSANFQPPPPDNYPYYKARSVCFRAGNAPSGSSWTCSPTFQYLNLTMDNAMEEFINHGDGISKYNCTNRDKGYTGKPWP